LGTKPPFTDLRFHDDEWKRLCLFADLGIERIRAFPTMSAALSCYASSHPWRLARSASIVPSPRSANACALCLLNPVCIGVMGGWLAVPFMFPSTYHGVLAVKVCARVARWRPAAVFEP